MVISGEVVIKLVKSNPVATVGVVFSNDVVSTIGVDCNWAKSNPVSTVLVVSKAGKSVILYPVSTTGVLSTFCILTKSNWVSVTVGVVVW